MNKVGISINASKERTTKEQDHLCDVLQELTLDYYSSSSNGLYFIKYERISIFERKYFYSKIKHEIGKKLKKLTMNQFLKKHYIKHTVDGILNHEKHIIELKKSKMMNIVIFGIEYSIAIDSYFDDKFTNSTSKRELECALYGKKLYDNSISNALERKSKRNDQYNRLKKNGQIGFKVSKRNKKFNLTINQPKSRKQRRYI